MPHYHWHTVDDYIDEFKRLRKEKKDKGLNSLSTKSAWGEKYGDYDTICNHALNGVPALTEIAEKQLKQFENLDLVGRAWEWTPQVSGGYLSIPEYLANSPTPMRRKSKVISNTSPLRIYSCTSCGAGSDEEGGLGRGLPILALMQSLQIYRPIELWLWEDSQSNTGDGGCISTVNVGTSPLNLAQAAYVVSSTNFARAIMFSVANFKGHHGNSYSSMFLKHCINNQSIYSPDAFKEIEKYIEWLRDFIGASPNDIFIPPVLTNNILEDPLGWVKKMTVILSEDGTPTLGQLLNLK